MSNLLIHEYPLVLLPSLAKAIGLNEAIVLQQIHYWLQNNAKNNLDYFHHDGKWWVKASAEKWQVDNFPFWGVNTIRRALASLEDKCLVVSCQPNAKSYDHTKWYTINYENVDKIDLPKLGKSSYPNGVNLPIEETNKETKNTTPSQSESVATPPNSSIEVEKALQAKEGKPPAKPRKEVAPRPANLLFEWLLLQLFGQAYDPANRPAPNTCSRVSRIEREVKHIPLAELQAFYADYKRWTASKTNPNGLTFPKDGVKIASMYHDWKSQQEQATPTKPEWHDWMYG